MIIGLAKNDDEKNLEVEEVAKGLFVVRNAYAGDYDFFASSEDLFSDVDEVKVTKIAVAETNAKDSETGKQ